MFPAIMPWPMTLAPTNDAIILKNSGMKNKEKKSFAMILEVIWM
jgi:hypothetical protein